jgi:DNA modification methylase
MTISEKTSYNRTLQLSSDEFEKYSSKLVRFKRPVKLKTILNKTINQDLDKTIPYLPDNFVDLLFLDPPYNMPKRFNQRAFQKKTSEEYIQWMDQWLAPMVRLLKPTASIYVCCDWRCSQAVYEIIQKHFKIRNRITWEREKGRGARSNWKNSMEDIWYCTVSDEYTFNLDAVKLRRSVLAPYKASNGDPKDWEETKEGKYRLTHPSNLWTDITIPFWSMRENTDHPTQKPEKMLAKIILASSNTGDVVLDPFLGSGTTSVTAKKLERHYVGIEIDEEFCCLAEKRLQNAGRNKTIQGYESGVFWERNALKKSKTKG